jgi:hypothetical protein
MCDVRKGEMEVQSTVQGDLISQIGDCFLWAVFGIRTIRPHKLMLAPPDSPPQALEASFLRQSWRLHKKLVPTCQNEPALLLCRSELAPIRKGGAYASFLKLALGD